MVIQLLRSRAFAISIHVMLWLLLILCVINLGGTSPRFVEADTPSTVVNSPIPSARITNLFSADLWPDTLGSTNFQNLVYTRHFIPPVVPPPPPPTTKKIQLTYHGFFQTGDDPARAFLTVENKIVTEPTGAAAAPTWIIAEISAQSVVLTNAQSQTNIVQLNKSTAVAVPAQ